MAGEIAITVNGRVTEVSVDPEMLGGEVVVLDEAGSWIGS